MFSFLTEQYFNKKQTIINSITNNITNKTTINNTENVLNVKNYYLYNKNNE